MMFFCKIFEKYFSRKVHFLRIVVYIEGIQWFGMSFSHFSHFCGKVRNVAPFWPKSKSSEKHCRFYHAFWVISALLRKSACRGCKVPPRAPADPCHTNPVHPHPAGRCLVGSPGLSPGGGGGGLREPGELAVDLSHTRNLC